MNTIHLSTPAALKALWKGKSLERIWIAIEGQGADLHPGRTAQALDAADKRLTDDQGTSYTFDKLLLATGGTPRRLPWGGDDVIYYRTLDDYQRLRALTERGQRFAVIGGGFIGSEIAAALAMNGKDVVMLFPGAGIGDHVFGSALSAFLNGYYQQHGVEVLAGETAAGLERRGGQVALRTAGGRELLVDGVVAGIGIEPNIALAEAAGLDVDNGVVVDALLRTSHPDIYAAAATWPTSQTPRSASACALSTRITPIPWAGTQAAIWPANRRPMLTYPSSTRISSIWATKQSENWTRG